MKKGKKSSEYGLIGIPRNTEKSRKRQARLDITPTRADEPKSHETILLTKCSEKQTELLGMKYVHYLALEAIIFKVRVKVAQPAVLGHSAKSQAYQRQPESAESRKCRECVAKAKPVFPRLNRNHRQDPQGPREGLHPGFAVTLIKAHTPKS